MRSVKSLTKRAVTAALATTAVVLAVPALASAATLHVESTGADSAGCGAVAAPCASVGHAVTEAVANDTIRVGAGTFTGTAQVVINKNITLRGQGIGTTTLQPGYDTGNGGDARGWFLVNNGAEFRVNNLTLDGNSSADDVWQAIRLTAGQLVVNSVHFTNIRWGTTAVYAGTGIGTLSGTDARVSNSRFTNINRIGVNGFGNGEFVNNTYVGKGAGNHLDYALDLGGGAVWDVTGNTVSGNTGEADSDGSTSAGFLVTTFSAPGTTATFTGNNVLDNTTGIFVGFDSSDTSTVEASFNRIAGNGTGIRTTDPGIEAENNWWGCNDGPNAPGCDATTGPVDADPWLVLNASASPSTVYADNGESQVTASLRRNSDGEVAGGGFPDNVSVGFATAAPHTVSPASDPTDDGRAQTAFDAAGLTGATTVDIDLDGELVQVPITVVPGLQGPQGPAGPQGPSGDAGGVAGTVGGSPNQCIKKAKNRFRKTRNRIQKQFSNNARAKKKKTNKAKSKRNTQIKICKAKFS